MSNEENPLLKKITLPGKRFRMPSRGLFYKDGEIDDNVENGEVEVFSMTTIDEMALRSPEFLFSGEAIERVFSRCIPEIKKPLRLLAKDVDYLLACLRVVSYGGTYQINTRCPECEEKQQKKNSLAYTAFMQEVTEKAKEQNIDLDAALLDDKVQRKINSINDKQSDEQIYNIDLMGILQNNTTEIDENEYEKYTVILSNSQKVQITPLKMDSSVAALQFQNEDKTLDLTYIEEFVSFILACTVLSVDDIHERDLIEEWAKALPINLKGEIDKNTNALNDWGTDFSYTVVCKNDDCDHERNVSTLLNPITFFMKPSR